MTNEIKDYFSNKDNCLKELCSIRQGWGDKGNNKSFWETAWEVIAWVNLYGPKELSGHLEAIGKEAHVRETHFTEASILRIWINNGNTKR